MQSDQPWFRGPKNGRPFDLFTSLTNDNGSFWDGTVLQNAELVSEWNSVISRWTGTIAVGGLGYIYLFPQLAMGTPIVVPLSQPESQVHNIAWTIHPNDHLKPLILATIEGVIVILDVTDCQLAGQLRGHGGRITSIVVHPTQPNLFCTTSQDFTTRIYDLSLLPTQVPNNMHWLPSRQPSLAGAAFGLHMSESEGEGIGQCVAVMVGGRSGGHRASVLCCAFHPSEPLIATGGVDRAVKIWRIPPSVFKPPAQPTLAREDKPLFSTNLIHKARVTSMHWLADDILASFSAPALMRRSPKDREDVYWEEGTVAVWQWLGLTRFFPPGRTPQNVMRGTASDWRNSESFKILSEYHLPQNTDHVHVYRSLSHDPVLLIPAEQAIRLYNIADFEPRVQPEFSSSSSSKGKNRADDPRSGGEDEHANVKITRPPPRPIGAVNGWEVVLDHGANDMLDISACSMGLEGRVIVAIGRGGALLVWRLRA